MDMEQFSPFQILTQNKSVREGQDTSPERNRESTGFHGFPEWQQNCSGHDKAAATGGVKRSRKIHLPF